MVLGTSREELLQQLVHGNIPEMSPQGILHRTVVLVQSAPE
ncbi:MAG: hypothetical protein WBG73_14185 [Coleofasciculaceae cyanobacterium]